MHKDTLQVGHGERNHGAKRGSMKFTISEEEYRDGDNNFEGRCIACGEVADGVEPDARGYNCDACDAPEVYGLAELLLMGMIEFTVD